MHNFMPATQYGFALCDSMTLTFDRILISGRELMVDYLCGKFDDFSFRCFGSIALTMH